MKTKNFKVLLLLTLSSLSFSSLSEWSKPSGDRLLVQWSEDELKTQSYTNEEYLEKIRENFLYSGLPGQSWRYDKIYSYIQALGDIEGDEFKYFKARLLQHSHQFYQSEKILKSIRPLSNYYVASRLMMAQVIVEQRRFEDAKRVCLDLVLVQSDVAAGCMAATLSSISSENQQLLTNLIEHNKTDHSDQKNDGKQNISNWFLYQKIRGYTLAGDYEKVLESYNNLSDNKAFQVADLAMIAEAYLNTNQPQAVFKLLENKISEKHPDDALIIQLARAEDLLSLQSSVNTQSGLNTEVRQTKESSRWRDYADFRIGQRLLRNDVAYGEVIALYYSTLNKDPKLAELWSNKYEEKVSNLRTDAVPVQSNDLSILSMPLTRGNI
ncbi:MAG: hypothetical protein P1U57_09545 [Oleibacter sp.]|nr:hypothetical protein [Thalassolituus sp.]